MSNTDSPIESFISNNLLLRAEIGGHACPRLGRPVSVSAIFQKNHVRVRVRVRGVKKLHVRVRVRVRDLKKIHVHVRVRVRDLKNFYVRVREFTSRRYV